LIKNSIFIPKIWLGVYWSILCLYIRCPWFAWHVQ